MFLKNLKIILIPNYLLFFSPKVDIKLKSAFSYSLNISFHYLEKFQYTFYKSLSYISYNPYLFPKFISTSIDFKNFRKCVCGKYIIIYKISKRHVEILDIFHGKSNYLK